MKKKNKKWYNFTEKQRRKDRRPKLHGEDWGYKMWRRELLHKLKKLNREIYKRYIREGLEDLLLYPENWNTGYYYY